ncbi:MAG: hypothetical protein LBJ80_04640 [Rickettsiales bacterium]|nr:hypothetical protein [Rickettsiales bacterium]MDR1261675.1 hypothetical protein [Rickettsiales bacterium]
MPKGNNDKSWPYQEFHDANKSSRSDLIWELRSYRYNNSGEIEDVYYKWGRGTTSSPGSILYEASYTGTKQNGNFLSFRK